jgi:hypothetical protein
MNKKNSIWVIVVIVVAIGGFYFGTKYASSSKTSATTAVSAYGRSGRAGFTGVAGGNATVGKIVSVGSNSFTLQLPGTAGSKIIFYSDSTGISKTVNGSSADLAPGTQVVIGGTSNSDGSLTANSIQIRPSTTTQATIPASSTQ